MQTPAAQVRQAFAAVSGKDRKIHKRFTVLFLVSWYNMDIERYCTDFARQRGKIVCRQAECAGLFD